MTFSTRQWRRFGAATAACLPLLGAAACSSSSSAPRTAAANTPSTTSTAPTAGSRLDDPLAKVAVAKAIAATKTLQSYSFRAVQALAGGATKQTTVLTGRAARPASIAYTLTVGSSTQQVVRVGGRTFLRVPPAGWKALAKPGPAVDPLTSLLPLLNNLQHARLHAGVLSGDVAGSALSQAHLAPAGAAPGAVAPVSFTLDAAGRVTSVDLRLSVQAGAKRLQLNESTTFTGFNHAPPIKAPGVLKPTATK